MRVAALSAVLLFACDPAPRCPEGTFDDPPRAARITATLASLREGAALLETTTARVCFARGASVLDEARGVVRLDSALDERESAARLGHLLVHVRDGSPYREGADCDVVVARALDAEARAHVIELELRRALGVPALHALDRTYRASTPDARAATVRAYLEDHPDGAPGIDALARSYRERCERAR